jgi:hypothetical protein
LPGIRVEKLMSVEIEVEVNCRQLLQLRRQLVVAVCVQDRCSIGEELRLIWNQGLTMPYDLYPRGRRNSGYGAGFCSGV